ncbi:MULTISPECIES: nitrous oxide reductase accessory protein NosL [Sulfurimonas]|uniref:nitrous oxide reductase accessory protein NosL n=1 Tax=Sulfurimonas TaxID=202746 RepID=UPI00125F7939|nr:nitrous oxide reductase accessory protein NosL [Sulfurimonas hydrogeniphila]
MSIFKFFILVPLFSTLLFSYPNYSQAFKEKKLYPMGEKIYKKKCSDIDVKRYNSYEELSNALLTKKSCATLNKKYLEALALYLWEVKRVSGKHRHFCKLTVSKDEKCPVCGMLLYKYPSWISRIEYTDKNVSFDGIKDMMKYYFEHPKKIKHMLVQEYYTQQVIDAKKAYFVMWSDVYGPMGNELIAFKDEASAKRFYLDHKGKKILKFDDITPEDVYKLDE